MTNIFTRSNILNALLALCTAIEFCYDLGDRFGRWYRNGGDQQIRNAFTMTVAALLWLGETARLGYAVVKRDAPVWAARLNEIRNSIGKQFIYAA
tara:strand:- start:216 stop:500 length:285 start_codon:yes stop_codon:yes gene_type:complete